MNYKNLVLKVKKNSLLTKVIIFSDTYLPPVIKVIYIMTLIFLISQKDFGFFNVFLIPLFAFIVAILIRKIFNTERPFQVENFSPLVNHSTGKGCPSLHATSSAVISIVISTVNLYLGIFLGILTLIICLTRILTGVHFIRDVLVGVMVGLSFGCLIFII
ncbi:MAG: phosphatase PAP2 family protein [Anaerotignaceae bacterium]